MHLSIIIVAFRNKEKLRVTLRSIFDSKIERSFEVIVVDNDSQDGTAEMVRTEFPQVKLIENQNTGFSKANNLGISHAAGKFVLLLNPDTELKPNTLHECLIQMETREDIGVITPKLVKADGKLDLASRRSFPSPFNSLMRISGLSKIFKNNKFVAKYNLTYLPEDQETEVDSVSGAFLMTRRSILNQVGLLDEDFFMYGEDIDLCYRIKHAGYRVVYYPKVTAYHYKGSSSSKVSTKALYAFHQAMWIFFVKHYIRSYWLLAPIIYLAIWVRFSLLYLRNLFRKQKFVSK